MKRNLKVGDRVMALVGRQPEEGVVTYVSSSGYEVAFSVEGCDEPFTRLYRFNEVEEGNG
ncbi:hypothetical protein [Nocardia sp. NPDC057455]|uniref:hypothetical protein n=1 Tax=Nocardia sp. NPDC057455 TaxID=3346138 RepID=UPI0036722B11